MNAEPLNFASRGATPLARSTSARRDSDFLAAALARVAEGDRAAFAQVYHHTSAKLFGVCLRVLGNRSEAEDALQEAFIKVWLKAAAFDPSRSSPITWLAALVRNTALDRLRARASRPSEPLSSEALAVADSSASPADRLEASEQSRLVARCIDQLDARQAAAIRDAVFGGATYAALARKEGVPLGTMKSWVRRGLVSLKSACSTSEAPAAEHRRLGAREARAASLLRPLPMQLH
ncbi:MAG TPA: sigma-70 family RNA polymerase sigma factor [Allosphingosinicella sp.]|nr:sigma-70 family RNA polymerase sigma factor [Allosphingosinicella sp.]